MIDLLLVAQMALATPDPETITIARALDKVTARITELELPKDVPIFFGTLAITSRHCEKTPPTEAPETSAFLQIDDEADENGDARIFSGWMFASSPALNPLEHPVYDIWVIDCKTLSDGEGEGSE